MNSNDLLETKQRLLEKLGPSYGSYIQLLGKWFRGSISKEAFDQAARKLIDDSFVLEHNQFWLAFFHHCANNSNKSISSLSSYQLKEDLLKNNGTNNNNGYNHIKSEPLEKEEIGQQETGFINHSNQIKCLPNKVMTHMRIFVIAWEMGLDSVNDNVSIYINLALHHFLKNILTEAICSKTGYRLRENRFKYAAGIRPLNPYLNNSLKIISSNLEYDPYQIESNKMHSSLVDSYVYNDSLFPGRLYEAQALYEYACSTAVSSAPRSIKKLKRSRINLSPDFQELESLGDNFRVDSFNVDTASIETKQPSSNLDDTTEDENIESNGSKGSNERSLTLFHLLMAFLSDRTIISSQGLYSLCLERIITRLNC